MKVIREAQTSSSVSGVRSFIGMATFSAKFIPNFSDVTKPLRDLTKKNAGKMSRNVLSVVSKSCLPATRLWLISMPTKPQNW